MILCLYMHSHYPFCCRWLQIAKKMLAKSKKEGGSGFESSGKGSNTNGRRPLPHPASGQSLATVGQTFNPHSCYFHSILFLQTFKPPFKFPFQPLLLQVGRVGGAHLPTFPRTFNGSENDLTLAYNSSLSRPLPGGRVRYNPDGRTSPEVRFTSWSFSESRNSVWTLKSD